MTTAGAQQVNLREMDYRSLPGVRLIEILPKGQGFLAATLDMWLRWHRDGEIVREWFVDSEESKAGALNRIRCIAVNEEATRAYVCAGTKVCCLNLETGEQEWWHRPRDFMGFIPASPYAVCVTPVGSVAISTDTGLFDLRGSQGSLLRRKREPNAPHWAFLSPDRDQIIGADGVSLSVWDAESLNRVHHWAYRGHIHSLAVCAAASVAAVRTEGMISLRDWVSGEVVNEFAVNPGTPFLSILGAGERVATGMGTDCAIYSAEGQVDQVIRREGRRALTAVFAPGRDEVMVGYDDGFIETVTV